MWRPPKDQQVSDKEIIGRRLFGGDYFLKQSSSHGKAGGFKLDRFIETRPGCDLSVDRMGLKTANAEVISILLRDCEKHACDLGKVFSGWAALPVANIRGKPHYLEVKPTPILGVNEYHADVLTAAMDKRERNRAAFALAQLSDFVPPMKTKTSWLSRMWSYIMSIALRGYRIETRR